MSTRENKKRLSLSLSNIALHFRKQRASFYHGVKNHNTILKQKKLVYDNCLQLARMLVMRNTSKSTFTRIQVHPLYDAAG